MNNVNIIGRITNDLEVREVRNDLKVLSFTIAINERTGTNEESYFFDIVSWNKQAETIATYFKKGQRIGVNGKLKQERFQDKEGKNRSRVVIVLREFDFIEPKDSNSFNSGSYTNKPIESPPPKPDSNASSKLEFDSFPNNQNFGDDEVPF